MPVLLSRPAARGRALTAVVTGLALAVSGCGPNDFLLPDAGVNAPTVALAASPPLATPGDSITVVASDTAGVSAVGVAVFRAGVEVGRTRVVLGDTPDSATVRVALPFGTAVAGETLVVVPFASNRLGLTSAVRAAATTAVQIVIGGGAVSDLGVASVITRLLFYPRGNVVVAVDQAQHRVLLLSASTGAILKAIPVGASPMGASFLPANSVGGLSDTLLVASNGTTALSVVDLLSGRPTTALPLGAISLLTRDATTGVTTDRSLDVSDRPLDVTTICVPSAGSTACAERAAVIATSPATGSTTPLQLVRYLALSGPRAGTELLLTDHLAADGSQPGAVSSTRLDATVRRPRADGSMATMPLVTNLPVMTARLNQTAPWALAATRDFGTTLGAALSVMGPGRVFLSTGVATASTAGGMRDLLANVGGTVTQVLGGGDVGPGSRVALLTTGSGRTDVAVLDRTGSLRLTLPNVVSFAFVEPGLRGANAVSQFAVVVRGDAASRQVVLVDLAGDAVRDVASLPVATTAGPITAWMTADGRRVVVALLDGTRVRVVSLTPDR